MTLEGLPGFAPEDDEPTLFGVVLIVARSEDEALDLQAANGGEVVFDTPTGAWAVRLTGDDAQRHANRLGADSATWVPITEEGLT